MLSPVSVSIVISDKFVNITETFPEKSESIKPHPKITPLSESPGRG